MRICVISPDRRQGNSTVSALLAASLAQTQNYSTCLTFSGSHNHSLESMIGLQTVEDKTRNLSQILRLLESNAISEEDVRDYCVQVPVIPNMQFIDTTSETVSEEDSSKLLQYVVSHLSHEIVITDVTTEIYDDVTKMIIEQSDLVVMVLTQSKDVWEKLAFWKQSGWMEMLNKKGLLYIFNQFDAYVDAFRDTTKKLGLRHNRCAKISYNPFIKRMGNMGKLQSIVPYILDKDPRVIELNHDLKECLMVILANLGRRTAWKS